MLRLKSRFAAICFTTLITLLATTPLVEAQNRLRDRLLAPFRQVSHTQKEEGYVLQKTHGPWLIMCASFMVEGKHEAETLCEELRAQGLDAYLYEKEFDYSEQVEGLGFQKVADGFGLESKKMRALHPDSFTDISVLVGNFAGAEDKNGLRSLEKIKHLFPKTLHVSVNSRPLQRMGTYREIIRRQTKDEDMKKMGPMRAAFMIPNPMLPDSFFERQVVDPIVSKMNKGDKFSLLNNPNAYTVKIATFKGDSTFNDQEIEEQTRQFDFLKRSGRGLTESRLMEAEVNANFLTEKLREAGVEAYSYHDRHSSMVCVGSFEWVVRNPDSIDKQINPEAQAIVDKFKAKVVDTIPGVAPYYETKTFIGPTGKKVAMDLIPVPVTVPRLQ